MKKQSLFLFIFLFSFLGVEMNAVTSDVAVSMRVPAEYLVTTLTIESSEKTVEKRVVSYTHHRAHETKANLVCRLLLEKKKKKKDQ